MKPSEASAELWQQSLLGKDLSRTALGHRAEVKGQAAAQTAPVLGRTQPLLLGRRSLSRASRLSPAQPQPRGPGRPCVGQTHHSQYCS